VFACYGSAQSPTLAGKLELTQYLRFMQESGLIPQATNRAKAEVLFYRQNKSKSISFWRWVEILAHMAKAHFKASRGFDHLTNFLSEVLFPAPGIRQGALPLQDWNLQLQSEDLRQPRRDNRSLVERLFAYFRSKNSALSGQMTLANYLVFVDEFHIVPELVSKVIAIRLFRAAQRDAFNDLLSLEEMDILFCYLGFASHPTLPPAEAVEEVGRWLGLSAQRLKVLESNSSKKLRLS